MKYIVDTEVIKAVAFDDISDAIAKNKKVDVNVAKIVGMTEALIDLIELEGEAYHG